MNEMSVAIELSAASWEQFIGAALRCAHCERLLAGARARRTPAPPAASRARPARLLPMLAICVVGFVVFRL